MATTTAAAAARSVLRSASSIKTSSSRLGGSAKTARSSFSSSSSTTKTTPLSTRIFRCPAELSACAGSLQPFHTVTASALMTSMLSLSRRDYGWLSEGI